MAKFDETAQAVFLAVVKQGLTRAEAAERAGVSTATVRATIKMGLDEHGQPREGTFAYDLKEIELDQLERVESKLYEAALRGEPWAVQMWLKGKARDTWAEKPGPAAVVNVSNTQVNVEGTPEERRKTIAELQDALERRAKVIDVPAEPAELPSADAEEPE